MKQVLQDIIDFAESLDEQVKTRLIDLARTADKKLILKKHHDEVVSQNRKRKNQNKISFIYFLIGTAFALFGFYQVWIGANRKHDRITRNIELISTLCNSGSYTAARKLLEDCKQIDAADERLETQEIIIDAEEIVNNQLPVDVGLMDRLDLATATYPDNMNVLNNAANLHAFNGDFETAIELHKRTAAIARSNGNIDIEFTSLTNLAYLNSYFGHIDSASVYYELLVPLYQKHNNSIKTVYLEKYLLNAARHYTYMQIPDSALKYVQLIFDLEDVDVGVYAGGKMNYAEALRLYDTTQFPGRDSLIEASYLDALSGFRMNKETRGILLGGASLADFYSIKGSCDLAMQYIDVSLQSLNSTTVLIDKLNVYGHTSSIYLNCKAPDKAYIYNQMFLITARENGLPQDMLEQGIIDSTNISKILPRLRMKELEQVAHVNMLDQN